MNGALIVFAKEPVLGTVKTRLKSYFSDEDLLRLYGAFIKDTLNIARRVRCGMRILAFSSPSDPSFLKRAGCGFELIEQKGVNLGERMHNAFRFAKDTGASKMVIIGSDSPTLPASSINKAFDLLDRSDLVLGPSFDGGYYLIGLKSPCAGLFKDIAWSSPTVFKNTIKNAQMLKKKAALLDKRYDIDDVRALFRLKNDLSKIKNRNVARWTKKFMNSVIQLTDKKSNTV